MKKFIQFNLPSIKLASFLLMLLMVVGIQVIAQNNPGVKAAFGIEADIYANKRDFGTFTASGTNDWFKTASSPAGTGLGIIDTTGTAALNATFMDVNARNMTFTRDMGYKGFSLLNNKLFIDAHYIRDFHKTDPTAYITSNKNGQNPSVWQGGTSQVNDKCDVLDGMVAFARNGSTLSDSLWMMGALSIIGTNGSRYFDMEFYQTDLAYSQTTNSFTGAGADAGHTSWIFNSAGKVIQMGDFIVASTFGNAGITDLEFRIWVSSSTYQNVMPSGFKFNGCLDGASQNATFGYASIRPNNTAQSFFFGAVNTGNTQAAPWGSLDQQSALYTNYSANQFLEFAVNFTKLGVDPASLSSFANGKPCKDIARKLVIKSRTSLSFTSSLVDFLGPLNIARPNIQPTAGVDRKMCYDKPIAITASLTNGNLYANPVITWTADMGGSISGSTSTATITALTPGRYIVSASRFAGCEIDGRDTLWVKGDRDCDNVIDVTDIDDDNDAVLDASEIGTGVLGSGVNPSDDADGDGIPNYKDPNFCTLNAMGVCFSLDKDGDGIINQFDLDSDNDGITDLVETGGVDTNGDGLIDLKIDGNGNGLYDVYDVTALGFGLNGSLDFDGDGRANFIDLDSDNDGISDIVEAGGADSNGDGKADTFIDVDKDGLHDFFDVDIDNDGIAVSLSLSLLRTEVDANNDGTPDTYIKDASFVDMDKNPNYLDLDSDNDGIPDIVEAGGIDANNDGKIDGFSDTEGDGWAQSVDGDLNNDGVIDNFAGVLIFTGLDANSDGRPDLITTVANLDKTGYPNPYDIDSDDDGIVDTREVRINDDTDFNGVTNGPDANNNGWSDVVESLPTLDIPNTDAIGKADYLDIDADDDGIPDNIEGQLTNVFFAPTYADLDKDGLDDRYDNNDNLFGGAENNGITPVNTDGDAKPDYTDEDADNDSFMDKEEGWDRDGNGILDNGDIVCNSTLDSDGDGLRNAYDAESVVFSPTNGTTPYSYPDERYAGAERDWRDLTPLPVSILNMFAQTIEENVRVNWEVGMEINVANYEVERSEDATNFSLIGSVDANQSEHYQFLDESPLTGKNYYRLRTVDVDGKYVYSKVVLANFEESTVLNAYPNPATDKIQVLVPNSWLLEGTMLTISDMSGRIVMQKSIESSKDTLIRLTDVSNGVYTIKVVSNGNTRHTKFVVAK